MIIIKFDNEEEKRKFLDIMWESKLLMEVRIVDLENSKKHQLNEYGINYYKEMTNHISILLEQNNTCLYCGKSIILIDSEYKCKCENLIDTIIE